jgi:hypothetical protein
MLTNDIVAIYNTVHRWFDGDQDSIEWFFNKRYSELGKYSPNEVLRYTPEDSHHLRSIVSLLLRRYFK